MIESPAAQPQQSGEVYTHPVESVETRPFVASPRVDQLATALAKAHAEFPPIEKSKTAKVAMKSGGEFRYDYADLSLILRATRPVLAKHGIAVIQPATVEARGTVLIKTILLHESGQWLYEELTMPVADANDPQKVGSALTYGRRYAYCGMVGVQPENEDDDGAAAAPQGRGARRPGRAAAPSEEPTPEPTPGSYEAQGEPEAAQAVTLTHEMVTRLKGILKEHHVPLKEFGAHLTEKYGAKSWADIRQADYESVVSLAQAWPRRASETTAPEREPGSEG